MEVALTFGAVGDFLSIALLIKDIISALDECRGSAKAFRELIEEITLLQKNVDQIERIYQGPELGDGFEDLASISQTSIAQIRKCLEGFCTRISNKYGPSLGVGGSGNVFKDVSRKIQWKLEEKEVERFRSEIMGYRMSLAMFLQVTTVRLVRNNHRAVSNQINQAEANTMNTVRQYGQSIENYLRFLALCILARLHLISKLGVDVKQTASQMLAMMFAMSGELGIIRAFVMQLDRGIDNGEHFVLGDATGRSFPIHLKTIISWEAFDVILADRFKGKKGERRTRRKLYSLHESSSQLEINRSVTFGNAFVPNQKVDMSLICRAPETPTDEGGESGTSSCPWCRAESPGRLGDRVRYVNCRKHFVRVVIETDDVNRLPFAPSAPRSQELQSKHERSDAMKSPIPGAAHRSDDTKEAKTADRNQPSPKTLDYPESESDEENLSGLAHVTLQTRKLTQPKSGANPDPLSESSDPGIIGGTGADPPQEDRRAHSDDGDDDFDAEPAMGRHPHDREYASRRPHHRPATDRDARGYGIRDGDKLKYWDPDEEPIRILGSIFDAASLGKWIFDWTSHHCDNKDEPMTQKAAEVWLILLRLAGKMKRAQRVIELRVRGAKVSHTAVEHDFIKGYIAEGDALMDSLRSLLRKCEDPMYRTVQDQDKPQERTLVAEAGVEFVKTMFDSARELQATEAWLSDARSWVRSFQETCEILIFQEEEREATGAYAWWFRSLSPIHEVED
ncbi:hypothetical protein QBC34DRAFT_348557 [Podospora aff. communis PSN243]|uniref:Ubiquitin-like domain-containing protein n=1 Tax=Podospora aff. communis PSN243 TaxID=3040156 RepID=A0AAV9GTJ6_9PEZI|nr:hypothetical protein QBC34DRAFT_348557 [Podospora aff. communis PSN243]